jgi:hypothetical protein
MVRFLERSRGDGALRRSSSRHLSHTLVAISALTALAGSAHAQFSGLDDNARIGIMGPDGEMQYLPTADEMAEQAASRGADLSVFADYAQRRLELASLVTEIVYVDDDAPVGGDGTSWHTAHQSLQDALAQDYSGRLVEIRVAQGTYRPDRFNGASTNDPEATFRPRYEDTDTPTGIYRITGGYAGLGATDPDQNDPDQFPTIITGDLLGNDGPDFTNYEDNSLALFSGFNSELHGLVMEHALQAVFVDGFSERLTIDGCTIKVCSGRDRYGAVRIRAGTLVLKRSTFFRNRSEVVGGAVALDVWNCAIVSNRFLSNTAAHGGAVFAVSFSPETGVLQNNYFAGNRVFGSTGSVGGASAVYLRNTITACNTNVFNRSEDGPGGGFGNIVGNRYDQFTVLDVYHMNRGHTGTGLSEQFPSLSIFDSIAGPNGPAVHQIRGSFAQGWELSESNRPGSHASSLNSIRDNSGEEVLFVDLAGPDGIIGTLDDDPTPRPDSPNIDRIVDLEGAELALLDFADLNENGIVDEPLPFDLLGNPRSIDTPGIGEDGGIDAGAVEYAGDPARFNYDKPITGQRIDPMDGCEGDEPIRLYVNASGPVSGDGSSWDSPLLELHEALDIARLRCGPVDIWLAAGTYLPDFSVPLWRASFRPTSNVTILGGFAGWETEADERDPQSNHSILSGDRFGNDKADDLESMGDNAYRVVVSTGERGGGVLDGVIISGGNAAAIDYAGFYNRTYCGSTSPLSRGAGVTVLSGTLTLRNSTITDCAGQSSVAVSASGIGSVRLESSTVDEGLIRVSPPCAFPTDDPPTAISAAGIDSILVRPIELSLTDMNLVRTNSTNPLEGFFVGNTDLLLERSSFDLRIFLSGPVLVPRSGNLRVQSVRAESSLLRNVDAISSSSTELQNCTLFGNENLLLLALRRAPKQVLLSINNSVITQNVLAAGPLRDASIIRSTTSLGTNILNQINTVQLPSREQFEQYFVDYSGPDGEPYTGDEDLRLAPGSPAINTGLNTFVESNTDLDGNERIIGSVVDRGAYEFTGTCTGDVNGDGVIDLGDLNRVLGNFGQDTPFGDADGSGSVDMTDLNIVISAFGNACDG